MKKKLIIIIILIGSLIVTQLKAQVAESFAVSNFLTDLKNSYNTEMELETKIPVDTFLNQFETYWSGNKFTDYEKEKISLISKYLSEKRADKRTTFHYFLMTSMILKDKSTENLNIWFDLLQKYTESVSYSTKEIDQYTQQIYYLSTDNYVYWSKTIKWKFTGGTYKFDYNINKNKLKIKFTNVNLEAYYYNFDTLSIKTTNGVLDILENQWIGKTGKVTWEKYNYDANKIYAKLNFYKINLQNSKYEADSVSLRHTELLKTEILGKLSDEASSWGRKHNSFPMFVSHKNNFDNYKGNIHFKSGLTLKGKEVLYSGTPEKDAEIEYLQNGKVLLQANSQLFYESEGVISSDNSQILLFIAKADTISHPSVSFKVSDKLFNITRLTKGAGKRPFFNSYQNVEIEADNINWNPKDSVIYFLSQDSKDKFVRSANYFTKEEFDKAKMYETTNPLFEIKRFSTKIKSNTFNADEYSRFAKKEPNGMRQRFIGLWYDGYVDYNTENNEVIVLKKLYDYIEFFFGRKDYDVISIPSEGVEFKGKTNYKVLNCRYSTKTNDLYIMGVPGTTLSSAKRTGFIPEEGVVIMKKNRDMVFGGRLRAGLTDVYSKSFYFNYQKFEISFEQADNLVFTVITQNTESGAKEIKTLTSSIEKVSGKIRIDLASNKSGTKEITMYPILISKDTSYVFYDKKTVYDREKFMFKNYPFTRDSLLFIHEKELSIDGIMISGGILPDFEESLKVQDDYSLGFMYKTPEGGLKLFGGKTTLSASESRFDNYIKLSNSGLQANGTAQWYNTTIQSKEFNLYPDSLSTLADEIEIERDTTVEKGGKYSDVKGKKILTKWDSKNDFITYKSGETPMEMYNGTVKLKGTVTYRPDGLHGNGAVDYQRGTIYSQDFVFNNSSLIAEKANMKIKDNTENKNQMIITDMKSFVDVNSGKAVFSANTDTSNIQFADNKYINYPKHFVWDSKSNNVDIDYNTSNYTGKATTENKLDSAYLVDVCKFDKSLFYESDGSSKFVSTDKGQKGLTFYGTMANYDSEKKSLNTKEVKKIIVADIEVKPSSAVSIGKDGKMEKLFNTTVKARGRHNISNVDITIMNKEQYVASSGIYIFYDKNKESQNIRFDNITYSTDEEATVGHGLIEQYDKFAVSPYFDYYGEVFFNAKNDFLRFKGNAKIKHTCNTKPYWFYFETDINPDSVYLPLSNKLHSDIALNKARIYADILLSTDSLGLFASFMSTDPTGTAESIFSMRDSVNYISFNEAKQRYEISNIAKYKDRTQPGNYMDLDTKNCIINGEGKFSYTNSLRVDSIEGYGNFRYDLNSGSYMMYTLTYLDFFFNKRAAQIISEKIGLNISAEGVDVTKESYIKNMNNILGVGGTTRLLEDMSINGGKPKRFPLELDKTLVFSDVKFVWDEKLRSFKSEGRIGVGNIYKDMHNKYLKGYIQIEKDRYGDKIYIYLETNTDEWFFFTFSGGIMRTYSSVDEYNKVIETLKDKERKIRTDKGIFNYMLTNPDEKDLFIYKFTGKHPALNR